MLRPSALWLRLLRFRRRGDTAPPPATLDSKTRPLPNRCEPKLVAQALAGRTLLESTARSISFSS